jgi:aspartate kinase
MLIEDAALLTDAVADVDALCDDLEAYCSGLAVLGECTAESLDMVASFGERLSTTIFTYACKEAHASASFLDVRSVMRTDASFMGARVDTDAVRACCDAVIAPLFNTTSVIVTQGFIGATSDGRTTTLGRGGSDYTAAILGAACAATEICIWTDVSGVYTADPRIVATARPMPAMSFREVRELATYGAKVLHPETIAPAIDANIPVRVVNTFHAADPGTLITADQPTDADVHAVSMMPRCIALASEGEVSLSDDLAHTVCLRTTMAERSVLVVHVPTDDARVALDVAMAGWQGSMTDVALIAVCGPRVSHPACVERIARAAGQATMIVAGSSAVTTFCVVPPDAAHATLQALHALCYSASSE